MEKGLALIFVYKKDGKLKVANLDDSRREHASLVADGWEHIATLDACRWAENLHNERGMVDIFD